MVGAMDSFCGSSHCVHTLIMPHFTQMCKWVLVTEQVGAKVTSINALPIFLHSFPVHQSHLKLPLIKEYQSTIPLCLFTYKTLAIICYLKHVEAKKISGCETTKDKGIYFQQCTVLKATTFRFTTQISILLMGSTIAEADQGPSRCQGPGNYRIMPLSHGSLKQENPNTIIVLQLSSTHVSRNNFFMQTKLNIYYIL